jgi:trigger factor
MKSQNSPLQQLPDQTFILNFTISPDEIESEYQKVLTQVAKNFSAKGFRKGKAPISLVEENTNPDRILEEVAQNLISHQYQHLLSQHQLHPIIPPQVKVLNPPITRTNPWQLEIKSCQTPQIKLGDYKTALKKINSQKHDSAESQLNQIFDQLLSLTQVDLPQVLTDYEIENRLTQLVDQINQAGLSFNQYLKSKDTTLEKLKEDLKQQVAKEWTLNLVIDQVSQEEKINLSPEELKDFATKAPKGVNPNTLAYLLLQQKVLTYLKELK